MRTRILLLAALLASPAMATAQVSQVPRGSLTNPDREREKRHYDSGWSAMRSEDWAGAVKEFQQVIDIDPGFALAYYSLGRAEMGLHQFSKAIDAYVRCRELYLKGGGDKLSNQLDRNKYLDDKILEQEMALQQAQQAGAAKQATGTQQLYITELRNKINQLSLERDSSQNLVIDTTVPFFVPMALGAAYHRSGKLEDAEREYRAAIDANSASGETHNNLAALYMATGRFQDAATEVALAEKTGFKVNPQMKQDIQARAK